jgi:hypothetical protein
VPTPRRARRGWLPWALAAGGAMLVVSGAIGVFLLFAGSSPGYPAQWDARVAPIAARVETLRGKTFKHPVPVTYLSNKDFEKTLTVSAAQLKKQRKRLDQATGLYRAAGLIGGNVDLAKAFNATQTAGTIAYYDPDRKAVFVRGNGPFTIETRVTLAHELTHVLQDQYFDLSKLRKLAEDSKSGSSDALTALIEGDALRVQDLYLKEQSTADRREYGRLSRQGSSQARQRTQDIPAAISVSFDAPYIFGPPVVRVLDTTGGNSAIDDALTGAPPSTRMYFNPGESNLVIPPVAPAVKPGEKKLPEYSKNEEAFDDFTLYLMLAARLDPATALRAADAYETGSEVLYSDQSGAACFRAALEGVDPDSHAFLAEVITRWTRRMPAAGIESTGTPIVFHACDPGRHAPAPNDTSVKNATALAAGRATIVATFVGDHLTSDLASCVARLLVDRPTIRREIVTNKLTAAGRADVLRAAAASGITCRENPRAGIP